MTHDVVFRQTPAREGDDTPRWHVRSFRTAKDYEVPCKDCQRRLRCPAYDILGRIHNVSQMTCDAAMKNTSPR